MGKKSGPKKAAAAQVESSQLAIEAQNEQFDYISELVQPFIDNGMAQQDAVNEASSIEGFDNRLNSIFDSESFGRLRDERMDTVNNSLAQSGLRRSGAGLRELANVPNDVAFALEDTIFGRQRGLLDNAQNAAVRQGASAQENANNVSGLINQQGQATASGILQGQQATAQQNAQIASILAMAAFSDPALKENMEPVGQVCDLTMYEWDWKGEVPDFVKTMNTGYNAEEVKAKYPHHVYEVGGYLAIDYPRLNNELSQKLDSKMNELRGAA